MKVEKVVEILKNSLIMKHSFQNDIPLENGFKIFMPTYAISSERCFICDYNSLIDFAANNLLPDRSFFFIVNSPTSCDEFSFSSENSYFFLNIGMDEFIQKFQTLFFEMKGELNDNNCQKMQETWKKVITENETLEPSKLFYALEEFVACIVIEKSNNNAIPECELPAIMYDLTNFFTQTNIFPFQNKIVVLYSQKHRAITELDFSYSKLDYLLSVHNLKAGISNACRHTNMYATLYHTAVTSLALSNKLKITQKYTQIIPYDEYSTYYILHLCVQEFIRIHNHTDIIYLVSPTIIELYRYDKKHNSDLLNTLFYYLLSGRNTTETSKILYMHRNTVFNKLNKINSIIKLSLDDGNTQFKLLMSCFVVNYYKDYLKEYL